jgi:GNAT superfamily N-acetyltransferase
MDELSNEGVNTLGEYQDDVDVTAKHLQEEDDARQLDLLKLEADQSSEGGACEKTKWAVRAALDADVSMVTALVNEAYADGEGDLWEEGRNFVRTTTAEVQATIGSFLVCHGAPEEPPPPPPGSGLFGCVSFSLLTRPGEAESSGREEATVCEFGMLAVAREWRGQGIAGALVEACQNRAADLPTSSSSSPSESPSTSVILQCELLLPRDLAAHPHPLKASLYQWYSGRLGFEVIRRVPFEDAYPEVLARNKLNFACDAVVFQRSVLLSHPVAKHVVKKNNG